MARHIIAAVLIVVLAGCVSSKKPEIDKGRQLVKAGQDNAQRTMEKALEKVTAAYRSSELRHFDSNFSRDIAGLIERAKAANSKPEEIVTAQAKYIADRDVAVARVDAEIREALQVVEWARADRQLADNLNAVLNAYYDAGVDITAAQVAVQQVLLLMQAKRQTKGP